MLRPVIREFPCIVVVQFQKSPRVSRDLSATTRKSSDRAFGFENHNKTRSVCIQYSISHPLISYFSCRLVKCCWVNHRPSSCRSQNIIFIIKGVSRKCHLGTRFQAPNCISKSCSQEPYREVKKMSRYVTWGPGSKQQIALNLVPRCLALTLYKSEVFPANEKVSLIRPA
jgi:hypothetical protein